MTQHEYVFITISIILGLAITRLLSEGAALIRAKDRIKFHWSTAVWAGCIMIFILQLWWVGWELRNYDSWTIFDFFVLVAGAVFLYGASELALPVEDYDVASDKELDFLNHSKTLGRISALSMLGYFAIGPYVNIQLFENPAVPAVVAALIGAVQMAITAWKPAWFKTMVAVFAVYAVGILYLTA